ncbi:uncharacterized protein LOC143293708 [Babylonia areolata]|uniref:uncharacterized protein LOC143293708 n=1 Tax=Babylonia areolata TaxID=304850 RepID=UPI003FCF4657
MPSTFPLHLLSTSTMTTTSSLLLLTPLLTMLVFLMPSCSGGTFQLPEPSSTTLVQKVTVECGGGQCQQTMNASTCISLNVCALSCPTQSRTDFPSKEIPLTSWIKSDGCNVSTDQANGLPATADHTNGLVAVDNAALCSINATDASTTSDRLAVSLWVLPSCSGNCTLAQIGSGIKVFFHGEKLCVNSVCSDPYFNTWKHLVLQISSDRLTFAADGEFKTVTANTPSFAVPTVSSPLTVILGARTGNDIQAGDSYQMYDVRYYDDVLTSREIKQIFNNETLGNAGQVSECRCPHSHLTLTPNDPYTCQNENEDKAARVEMTFNTADTLVGGAGSGAWAGPDSGQFVLMVGLSDEYHVENVEAGLSSSLHGSLEIVLPNSENKSMTCQNMVCSVDLSVAAQDMSPAVFATRVMRQFNLTYSDTSPQASPPVVLTHLVVTGRCNCGGNAASCNITASPYVCDCDSDTHTKDQRCQTCVDNRFRQPAQFDCQGICNCSDAGVVNKQQMCDQDGGACQCKPNVEGALCDACKYWTHSLDLSNPLGCHECECHHNGSVSCDPQSGDCTCKANVKAPTCDRCEDGHFDVGPALECQPCGCDPKGVKPNSVCDGESGQCVCKDLVQGRTCNECKDEYYDLQMTQSQGCLPCGCSPVGSESKLCDKVTGQCPCQGGVAIGNRTCTPQILSVEPRYGPLIGGTLLTIRGQLLGNSSQPPSVFLHNEPQIVKSHNLTTVVVETQSRHQLGSVVMTVSWPNEPRSMASGDFTYMQDPQLRNGSGDIPDVSMFVSGGCGVLFKGSNFQSVAAPRISVTDQSSGSKVYSRCRHVQQDLQCITPDLSAMANPGAGSTTADLTFGLLLDGLRYPDLGPVTVLQDPMLTSLGTHDFQYPFETTITISGSGLKGGCSQNEVSVLIGVVSCDIVSFSQTHIECEPPKVLRGSRDIPIVVKMGSHISKQVGSLNYLELYETTYFIGIVCGVGAFLLLIVVIVVVCCCRRRRRALHRGALSMDKLVSGHAGQPNQYSELQPSGPLQPVTGFLNPVHQETVIREGPKVTPVPSAADVDLMSEFLNRVESSLWEPIKAAAVNSSNVTCGNVCTNRGKFARVIDGHFSTERAGQRHEMKITIKTLKEKLPEEKGMLPMWATAALRECLRLHRHGGDNVLSVLGLVVQRDRFLLLYPHMANRTLKDHIVDSSKEFSVRQLVEYGLQVADGLSFLNAKDLVHRDLATRNCWVDTELVVKIADAAFAWDFYEEEYVYDSARERYMPLRWMAPESLSEGYYDMRTDVWSLGVLLWELLTRGHLPFHEMEDAKVKDYVLEGYLLGKPDQCSDKLYELMKECWSPENEHRPGITSVVRLLGEELTGDIAEQQDIYVNVGENLYQNQNGLGRK